MWMREVLFALLEEYWGLILKQRVEQPTSENRNYGSSGPQVMKTRIQCCQVSLPPPLPFSSLALPVSFPLSYYKPVSSHSGRL